MNDIIQFNKFCDLHDEKNIIFCKTDYLASEFSNIRQLDNDIVLISGNSDYSINDEVASRMPPNVKKWFCHNNLSGHPKLEAIPMGIENSKAARRHGHGHAWPHAVEKEKFISYFFEAEDSSTPTDFIYANFSIDSNPFWRKKVKNVCTKSDFVNLEQTKLSYIQFINNILSHEAVVCPLGNGLGDNHRIYETLYLNRVPIVFEHNQSILYDKIYSKLPIVIVDDLDELLDYNIMQKKVNKAKTKSIDTIRFSYWKNKIMEALAE